MGLEELQKELYKKDTHLPEQKPGIFQPEYEEPNPNAFGGRAPGDIEEWQRRWRSEELSPKRVFFTSKLKWYVFWSGLGMGVAVILFFVVWGSWAFRSFDKSKVELEIDIPKTIESGEKVPIFVNYVNNNRTALNDVKLYLEYPSDSLPLGEGFAEPIYFFAKNVNIGNVAPREKGRLEFPTIIFGFLDERKEIKIRFTYTPVNFASSFENEYSQILTIKKIPLSVNWNFTEEAVSGQAFEAKLSLTNTSLNDFYNLRINIEYPPGFTFNGAEPAPSEGQNTWDFARIASNNEQDIIIRGRLVGMPQQSQSLKARLGILRENNGIREFILYDEIKTSTKIIASPLFVFQSVPSLEDEAVEPGEVLNFQIDYKNTTNVGIEKVELTVNLSGNVLDFTTLDIERGSFDTLKNAISWKSGEAPELNILSPGEDGKLNFSIRLKKSLPIEKFSDKNFTITSVARVSSQNVPVSLIGADIAGEHTLIFKVNSQIKLRQKGYYFESPISNSGPIPPKVGETTTYNIIWQMVNSSNDIENVKVESYLPAYVSWQGQIEPKGANVFYDSQTRKIAWEVGKLAAHTGILYPVKQVAFQIGLTPALSHLGEIIDLIGEAQISGKDAFTGKILQDFSPVIMTDLRDDPRITSEQGKVTQ